MTVLKVWVVQIKNVAVLAPFPDEWDQTEATVLITKTFLSEVALQTKF